MGELQLRLASPLPLRAGAKTKLRKLSELVTTWDGWPKWRISYPAVTARARLTLYLGMVLRTISVIGKVCSTTKWAPPGLIIRLIGFCLRVFQVCHSSHTRRSLVECPPTCQVLL